MIGMNGTYRSNQPHEQRPRHSLERYPKQTASTIPTDSSFGIVQRGPDGWTSYIYSEPFGYDKSAVKVVPLKYKPGSGSFDTVGVVNPCVVSLGDQSYLVGFLNVRVEDKFSY